MHDKLVPILEKKQLEVGFLYEVAKNPDSEIAQIMRLEKKLHPRKNFFHALERAGFIKVIAEVKRRSPSKGLLDEITDPLYLVRQYINGGASAISILTDSYGFGGNVEDLENIANAYARTSIPFLRKDFLIDPIQIGEAMIHGADAILLIVAVLGDQLNMMLEKAQELGIDALVEVHTPQEAEQAVAAGAKIIGVNNRDLRSFQVDTKRAFEILKYLPESVIKIAESGITEPSLAKEYYDAGYAAVLVGEALVKSTTPAEWIKSCK